MKLVLFLLMAVCFYQVPGEQIYGGSDFTEFAGSTPYNRDVKQLLQIAATDSFDFMKWKLKLFNFSGDEGKFDLIISYGYYLQSTLDFKDGGKSIHFAGKWKLSSVNKNNTRFQRYQLYLSGKGTHINLLKMDSNILHLIDENGKPYPGDASFGFILNRYPPVQN